MSFRDHVDMSSIKELTRNLQDFIDDVEEYGHVASHPVECKELEAMSADVVTKLREIDALLDKMSDMRVDWFQL